MGTIAEEIHDANHCGHNSLEELCGKRFCFVKRDVIRQVNIEYYKKFYISDIEQLVVFIRGVTSDFRVYEEFFSLNSLHGETKGTQIFSPIVKLIEDYQLDPKKLVSISTDGAPYMIGSKTGFRGRMNKWRCDNNWTPVLWHHCIIHQENLISKNIKMENVSEVVIKIVNWIRANALNHRKFKTFLTETDSDYGDVLLFSVVITENKQHHMNIYV
ncbi:general transcription factor II-I repeat domain-containing protein 2A-like [Octopus sinensis]|uniref:General transcription factor II-I repeat domain-containing protein 2A-like n=1 Tax=Octopus sinensis TaxID=2607531 RepID=A0A6P7TWC9_9MOLL|nr:general transcription factor II-I repeat domain-containing protein 2A-like [Octopus sinensis]